MAADTGNAAPHKTYAPDVRYSPEVAAEVCAHLSAGKSLRTVEKLPGMPNMVTIWRWLGSHEEFQGMYAQAKAEAADAMVEDMHAIADDETLDHNSRRIRVDTRKWIASKLKPKRYGEKVALTDGEGGPLVVTWATDGHGGR